MFFTIEQSFILNDMEKAFKRHKKFDYQLYYDCKKCCYTYGIEQLYHAKAIFEEKNIYEVENNNGISMVLTFISIALTTLTLWVSTLTDDKKKDLLFNSFIMYGLLAAFSVFILIVIHNEIIIPRRKNAYFYSIICDEIERRNKEECQNK